MAMSGQILRSFGLSRRRPTAFDYVPDAVTRDALARDLGLIALPHLRFSGEVRPSGKADFQLDGRLSALAVQPCVVTLSPVEAALDETVTRHFLADSAEPAGGETEMPEDVDSEPLPETIDLAAVAAEAMMLALPLYPRAPGAALAEPPAEDRDAPDKPFAALADLALRRDGETPG